MPIALSALPFNQGSTFGYTGIDNPTVPVGDQALSNMLQDPTAFFKQYGSKITGGFVPWFNNQTAKMTSEGKSSLWNDIINDFSNVYSQAAGSPYTVNKDNINDIVTALNALSPGKTSSIPGMAASKWLGAGTPASTLGGVTYDPATGQYNRQSGYKLPTRESNPDNYRDRFDNIFDYVIGNKQLDPTSYGGHGSTGNFNTLSGLFANTAQNRLENELTTAYRNLTGNSSAVLPQGMIAGSAPGTFKYYNNPGAYDTDYKNAYGNLMNLSSVKQFIDPAYQSALGKLKFNDTTDSRNAFNTAVSKYGLNTVNSDIDSYMTSQLPKTDNNNSNITDLGGGVQINTGGSSNNTTTSSTGGTGNNSNNTSVGSSYNFDPAVFGSRQADTGFRQGSRYFDEQTGNYGGGMGNLFGSTQGSV